MKKTKLFMDTVVQIEIVIHDENLNEKAVAKLDHAFEMFRIVEQACSRFSPDSELMLACKMIKKPVQISPILFEPLKFALEIAKLTEGEFDPTIGKTMEKQGFNRHYLTGEIMDSNSDVSATFKDIILDEKTQTLFLERPLVIDLGAVAKGFAIDLAANELKEFEGFVINAGGDLFLGGTDWYGSPWKIGIQHPNIKDQIVDEVGLSNAAICTSGSYERRNVKIPGMHHIMNPKTKNSPNNWVSCSIIAPFAMMADAFSTAAFLLGENGIKLIEDVGLTGKFITPALKIVNVGGNYHDNTEMA
ncbi:FAD:protein FMN transferase [Neobacillus sp. PS3-12]|jgi:FAD:protein FMN transferase|uniref:FAD:protein FMN transferase n=1 Tax=Neobacillus sp. PS3-12 TaxID=3070677 RepID=UPI0027DF28A3|nr:FAD:protein FMN transferase [Neobacillus sp. PS3-12]WML53122.1 FAD:protein FMN transferase [Neobacillus sp. PS3-12]